MALCERNVERGSRGKCKPDGVSGHGGRQTTFAVKTVRGKRPRGGSNAGFLIEEMFPDDMGYDGDIEVIHPSEIEDVESDVELEPHKRRQYLDTDDEMAYKLRRLSCDPQSSGAKRVRDEERGLKRRSQDMDVEDVDPPSPREEIEVTEVFDGQTGRQPPLKRRKKRPSSNSIVQRLVNNQTAAWSDTSEDTEEQERGVFDPSSPGSPGRGLSTKDKDAEMDSMDLG